MTARPKLADVAALAGVSLKTASRAMNDEYGVAAGTAERVRDAARQLGFRPNHLARALAGSRSSAAVGLVIPALSDPFFAELAAEVEATLAPRGLGLITASHGDDRERQHMLTRSLVERRVDALIVATAPGDASYLQLDVERGLVVGAVDRPLEGLETDTVTIDNRGGAHQALTDLLRSGHRRVAIVGFDSRPWTTRQRADGYRAALAEAGLPVDESLIGLDCQDAPGAERWITTLLRSDDPPTAVVTVDNRSDRPTIRAMVKAGQRLDYVVFDDVTDPDLLIVPPLTVVASEPRRLGAAVAAMTLERMDGLDVPPRHVVMPPLFQHPRGASEPAPTRPTRRATRRPTRTTTPRSESRQVTP